MSVASDSVAHDEGPHLPSEEALWNESWYFDFADTAAGLGGWIRLGLYPNEDRAWVNVLLCGPGLPTLALNDFHAVLPADPARVRTDGIGLDLQAQEPARSYRVAATGRARVYDDPAAALAGMGEMRLKLFAPEPAQVSGQRREAQIMIRHPNYSGLQRDQITQLFIGAHFLDRIEVFQGEDRLFLIEGGISISENPVFRFDYSDNGAETLRVVAHDTEGNVFERELPKTSPS